MSHAHYVLLSLLFLSQVVFHSAQNSTCSTFNCGRLGRIGYPFFRFKDPSCGGLVAVNCTASEPKAQFSKEGKWYPVNYINYSQNRVQIHDEDLQTQLEFNRCDLLGDFSEQAYLKSFNDELPPTFISFNITETRPFFKCKRKSNFPPTFINQFDHYNCTDYDLYYNNEDEQLPSLPGNLSGRCSVVHLPSAGARHIITTEECHSSSDPRVHCSIIKAPSSDIGVVDSLTLHWGANFTIGWKVLQACVDCFYKGGECQRPLNKTFQCSKKDESGKKGLDMNEAGKKGGNSRRFAKIGAFSATGFVILGVIFLLVYCTINKSGKLVFAGDTATTRNLEEFMKYQADLAPKRYSFKEIKKMTQSFKNKLGQGGYGSVFKGVQKDGKLVAVKVLSEIKGNGEEFVNEVASISRTSHVNIVSLLGYCIEGSKRALIYEFMPNGSLEKYIYDKDSSVEHSDLGWATLHSISVGIARGLEYLHRGCNMRILHFDIKPHNILLDQDFCPKISDFGLAKLCPRKDSIISMLGARGTAGYIAPEVFSRNFGGVSHKSDVYSYGMMILEMVGGRKNIDTGVDHTSEVYFPSWIYKRLELNEDLGLHEIVSEAQEDIPRKMILVGLWCIQTNPLDRPAMSRVLEMLEGSLELLEIPPKPYLFSSPGAQGGSPIN